MKKITFVINNDPDYDQRMQRICSTLSAAGYQVTLVGRIMQEASGLTTNYKVRRMRFWFRKGPMQYVELSIRLFFRLLFAKTDIYGAVDIDTALPVYLASVIRQKPRTLDAHEYFSELKEVITRPVIHKVWKRIEAFTMPRFPVGYTVGHELARLFEEKFGVRYGVIRNLPFRSDFRLPINERKRVILYQGAINEARGLEYLIPAMKQVDAELHIYGKGNYYGQCVALTRELGLTARIRFFGMMSPDRLKEITPSCFIGINLVEAEGLNQYYSLANKFFDYIQGGIPQVTMNFPEYAAINARHPVAVLIDRPEIQSIADAINLLLKDSVLYGYLTSGCMAAAADYCWEQEREQLIQIYKKLN